MRYSVQPRDRIFVKGYEFLSFTKNRGKNIGKNIGKNLSRKYSQKLVDHAKQSAIDKLKTTSKRVIQKATEATSNSIGNKITDRIKKVSRGSPQNNSETLTNEYDKETPNERYITPEERQKVIDDLRLI